LNQPFLAAKVKSFQPLQAKLKKLIISKKIHKLVSQALESETVFQSLQESASIHENCFIKMPINVSLPGHLRLRIHFWIVPVDEQNIHDHRFDFSSTVVAGFIENTVWSDDKTGKRYSGFRYHNDHRGRRLISQDDRKLSVNRRERHTTGNYYTVERDSLHTIEHSGDAITIILEDRFNLKPFANVYSPIGRSVGETPPVNVSDDLLREKLLEFCLQDVDVD